MSMDYHVYFGPYLVISNPIINVMEPRRTCPNDKCKEHKRTVYDTSIKFCPRCGEKIMNMDVERKAPTHNGWEIVEKLGEKLTQAFSNSRLPDSLQESLVLIPNIKFGIERDCWLDPLMDIPTELNIKPDQSFKECFAFTSTFGDEIEKLTEIFGKDAIALRWGMLMYAN